VLEALGRGYTARGHDRLLVIPGERDSDFETSAGRTITIRSPRLTGFGGYRVIVDRERVRRIITRFEADAVEVSDRFTLAGLGTWARGQGMRSTMVSHERLDAIVALRAGSWVPLRQAGDRWNKVLAERFDTVVCTTDWAAQEFMRIGATNVQQVPLGVDLTMFSPDRADPELHDRFAPNGETLLVSVGRLSTEKRPLLLIEALRALRRRAGSDCVLVVAGEGPLRPTLEQMAADLPVTFLGHVRERAALAALYASADVALALGPVETFGLAALEALASGTPVVAARTGAVAELLGPGAGVATFSHPVAVAAGVRAVLDWDPDLRCKSARRRAEDFPWSATIERMLAVHGAKG
jgi:alpha-1,6-mannosyltransferase